MQPQSTRAKIGAASLKGDGILYAPVGIHLPGLNGVEVAGNRAGLDEVVRLDFPEFREFRHRRLALAEFIRAARLQNRLFAAPLPTKAEAHVRLRIDGRLNFRFAPRLAVIDRNLDQLNLASAGPREAADFV